MNSFIPYAMGLIVSLLSFSMDDFGAELTIAVDIPLERSN